MLEHLHIHQILPLQAQGTCGKRGGKRLRAKEVENTKKSRPSKHTWTTHILIYELTETVASGTGPAWVHTRLSPRAESRHMYPSLSQTLSPINSHLQTKKKKKSFLQGSLSGEANHYLRLVPYIEVDDQNEVNCTFGGCWYHYDFWFVFFCDSCVCKCVYANHVYPVGFLLALFFCLIVFSYSDLFVFVSPYFMIIP